VAANAAPGRRVLTWRRLLVAAAAGLVVLSLAQAILRGDREALALAVIIVVGLVLCVGAGGSSVPCSSVWSLVTSWSGRCWRP
jgi:hypothetical protein